MRVLVTTTGGTGHIYPVVPIARAFRDAGHEVVWATSAPSVAVVERFGFRGVPAGVDPEERRRQYIERYPRVLEIPPRDRRPTMFSGLFAEIAAPVMASQLPAIFDEFRPDLVVHEVAELGVVPIATSREVPRVVVAFSGVLPPPVIEAAVAAVGPVWDAFALPVPVDLGLYDHDYVHPLPAMLGQRPIAGGVREVRPVAVEGSPRHRPEWLDDAGVERPLIYLTYGTEMGFLAPWRSLLDGLAQVDVDVVVTTANMIDLVPILQDLDETARARVHVRDYVPQAAVLARASLVVSHGGAGTMIAAGAAGVPQVVLPVGADQFDNADAFAVAGAAVSLDVGALTSDELAEVVEATLANDDRRRAARELSDHFAAMPHPDAVVTATATTRR
jgi:UDP:flavonoid glycosyltransferase YjiC (YdhE family)